MNMDMSGSGDMTWLHVALIAGTALVVTAGFVIFLWIRKRRAPASGSLSKLAGSLRDEKLKSSIILNAIDDGVVLVDEQKIIRLFNPGASKITGWASEEAMNLESGSVLRFTDAKGKPYADDADPFNRAFQQTAGTIRDNDAQLVTRDGTRIAVSLSITPLIDENNQATAAVAVLRDVSQERAAERERADFISTAAHEMRTPVAAIEGYLALALNDKVSTIDSRARSYLEKAHTSTEHLGKLFQDLLTSSKAEDGRLSSHPVVIEMGHFMEQLVGDLKFTAEKKGLFVEFALSNNQTIDATAPESAGEHVIAPLYYVHADPDRMREVVTNLFDNACKYTDQGKISLGLTGDGDVVQISVRDTGAGIPADDIPHLFQKFYRVDNSATRTIGGTGLGLFICRKIVELYHGRIWVESTLGEGSTFFINLPRLTPQRAQALQAAEAASQTALQPPTATV